MVPSGFRVAARYCRAEEFWNFFGWTLSRRDLRLHPDGDVKALPNGATPIDFAYSVHTEVGTTVPALR